MRWLWMSVVVAGVAWFIITRYDPHLPDTLHAVAVRPFELSPQALDGHVIVQHPRIVLPQLRDWDGQGIAPAIAARIEDYRAAGTPADLYRTCGTPYLLSRVSCWLITGNGEGADALAQLLSIADSGTEAQQQNEDAWQWALAYDLLSLHPALTDDGAAKIRELLRSELRASLRYLDGTSASLWHRRSSTAAHAWLMAVVLDPGNRDHQLLMQRAQQHYYGAVEALKLTEAWPEGYSYWINNRALPFALAAAATMNGLESVRNQEVIVESLRRASLWMLYATRPDDRIEGLGDEGPRVDLKYVTRRYIDLVAQLTRDRVFATYSNYLHRLHGASSYFGPYRWGFLLFNDPDVPGLPGIEKGELSGLEHYLPSVELFGPDAMNLLIARPGWSADDTLLTFRAGHSFSHHGHYDAGHFNLFKGSPLVVNSANYGNFFAENRLNYAITTQSKNSLLVLRPSGRNRVTAADNEAVKHGAPAFDANGQRVTLPTGSSFRSVAHWRNNLFAGRRVQGGSFTQYQVEPGRFVYVEADLSGAYDSAHFDSRYAGGKLISARREFLYLFDEDRLYIHDRVLPVASHYTSKWLLHTVGKPVLSEEKLLTGSQKGGVWESQSPSVRVVNGKGGLDITTVLPEQRAVRRVGGDEFQYYVEVDGIDGRGAEGFDGQNFARGANPQPWFDNPDWRIEIQSQYAQKQQRFMVVLSPYMGDNQAGQLRRLKQENEALVVLKSSQRVLAFNGDDADSSEPIVVSKMPDEILLVGASAGQVYSFVIEGRDYAVKAGVSGVLQIDQLSLASGETAVIMNQ
tara:strand:- start:19822 stop:22224 length:2403 start_codon:yes stop_codon:yes gene_type:complete